MIHVSDRPLKVLVLWANDRSANLGVRVLAEGAEMLAKRAWGSSTVVDFQDFGPGADDQIAFAGKPVIQDLLSRRGRISEKIARYDVILDTGAGDSFADIYGLKRLAWMVNASRVAKRVGTPVVLTPQTLGPFETRVGRAAGRFVLMNAARVHARDGVSHEYAHQMGRRPDVLATDMVFLLPQPEIQHRRDLILNVSGLLWNDNSHVDHIRYRRVVTNLIETLSTRGRTVTLLAHVLRNSTADSDHKAVEELADRYGLEAVVPDSLDEVRTVLAGGQVVIGSRMHACLNALSVGVPAIPLAYSRKFAPLMNEIGWRRTVDLRTAEDVTEKVVEYLDVSADMLAAEVSACRSLVQGKLDIAVNSLAALPVGERHGS